MGSTTNLNWFSRRISSSKDIFRMPFFAFEGKELEAQDLFVSWSGVLPLSIQTYPYGIFHVPIPSGPSEKE